MIFLLMSEASHLVFFFVELGVRPTLSNSTNYVAHMSGFPYSIEGITPLCGIKPADPFELTSHHYPAVSHWEPAGLFVRVARSAMSATFACQDFEQRETESRRCSLMSGLQP